MDRVKRLRGELKENDAELVRIMGKRMRITDEIGRRKKALGEPVRNPGVENEIVANARKNAAAEKIHPQTVEAVMRTLIAESRLRQESARMPRKAGLPAGPDDANVSVSWHLPPPVEFRKAVPRSEKAAGTIIAARKAVRDILDGRDGRIAVIMGPCSIHDAEQAEEYAVKIAKLQKKVKGRFLLVMRAYVEKPRSGKGWTGFLTEPYLDGTGDVQEGIVMTRKLLNRMAEMGVPAAVEFISPFSAQYIGDLVSWGIVGARSSGSQTHRDLASGLAMPVGFKNATDGSAEPALGAIEYAGTGHDFIGMDDAGSIRTLRTKGNSHCHLILRGGKRPNYGAKNLARILGKLESAGLRTAIVVDCSHGNSGKVAKNQIRVFRDVIRQRRAGNADIVGLMLESNLVGGSQKLPGCLAGFDSRKLRRGVSVTDQCLGWDETERVILRPGEASLTAHCMPALDW